MSEQAVGGLGDSSNETADVDSNKIPFGATTNQMVQWLPPPTPENTKLLTGKSPSGPLII